MDKVPLFDDDDNDQNELQENQDDQKTWILDQKGPMSERKTAKIIQLKSRLAHDSRFKIDDRFVDDDESEPEVESKSEIEAEKDKNLCILEKVIGKTIKSKNSEFSTLFVPRFDPTKEECKKFELETPDFSKERKRKLPSLNPDEIDQKIGKLKKLQIEDQHEKFDSFKKEDQQCYYEVGQNLKELFDGQTEDFTLGPLLDDHEFGEIDLFNQNEQSVCEPVDDSQNRFPPKQKRFFENREESEDDDDRVQIKIAEKIATTNQNELSFGGFFFDAHDPRLTNDEDQFYQPEFMQKFKEQAPQRRLNMIRALSLRKKSSLKNKRTEEKYTAKQKLRKKFIVQQTHRQRRFRRNFKRNKPNK